MRTNAKVLGQKDFYHVLGKSKEASGAGSVSKGRWERSEWEWEMGGHIGPYGLRILTFTI